MDSSEKKTSVLLYADWADPLRCLPLEEVGRLFLAILDYIGTGAAPRLDNPGTAMAWAFIRQRLDDNLEKWDAAREKRRQAGARGGRHRAALAAEKEAEALADGPDSGKQTQAKQANATFAKQTAANQAVPVPEPEPEPVPVPENVPVPGAAKAAGGNSPDGEPLPPPSSEQEQTNSPEAQWVALGLGKHIGPIVRQTLQAYREAGLEDGLLVEAMREAAAHQVKAPAAQTKGVRSLKKTVVFDFDGVIHSYASGWKGVDHISDPRVKGMKEAIEKIHSAGYDITMPTAPCIRRNKQWIK